MFRPCGDCHVCCSGSLIGNQYGNTMGPDKPCVFLVESKCTIYTTRPSGCADYQCAWTQGLISEELRPDKCGALVSVERGKKLKVMYSGELDPRVDSELKAFALANGAEVIHVRS